MKLKYTSKGDAESLQFSLDFAKNVMHRHNYDNWIN